MFKNKNTEEEEEVANDKLIGDNVKYDEDYYNNYIKQFAKRNRWKDSTHFTFLFYNNFSDSSEPYQKEYLISQGVGSNSTDTEDHHEVEEHVDDQEIRLGRIKLIIYILLFDFFR
jgi:uncharacterized protein YecE (DUF72 family)